MPDSSRVDSTYDLANPRGDVQIAKISVFEGGRVSYFIKLPNSVDRGVKPSLQSAQRYITEKYLKPETYGASEWNIT